jgi:AcrR family transcriptional regulator
MTTADQVAASPPRPGEDTRRLLIRTAERLYAERGIAEVSNRQVAEAAGQRNNSAVAYHIGTKEQLVRAIAGEHSRASRDRAVELAARAARSGDLRDHIACMVLPHVEHLASRGVPSWAARFVAQVMSDPKYGDYAVWGPDVNDIYGSAISAVTAAAPVSPAARLLRARMARTLLIHTCAEQEAEAARTGAAPDWPAIGEILIDAIAGLLLGPDSAIYAPDSTR